MNKIDSIKEIFKEVISLSKKENLYADCNYIKKKERRIIVTKTDSNILDDGDEGVKIRVWDGNSYLEFGTSSLEKKEIIEGAKKIIQKALKNKKNSTNTQELKVDTKIVEKDFLPQVSIIKPLEEKIELLKSIKDKILSLREYIVNGKVGLIEEVEEHIFVNEYKSLYQKIPLEIFITIANVMCDDKQIRNAFKAHTSSTFEEAYNKFKFKEFEKEIDNMKIAKKIKGGKYKVLLAPTLTGLLAHESFGHGMEADTMMKDRALASEWVGKKIGSDEVSIVDYSAIKGKNGEFYFDHEGQEAQKTYLVNKGIISTPMADTYSKTRLNLAQSNNARFESFDHKHYVRMSNTYFEPGSKSFEELLKSIDNGVLITGSSGGMEDPKGWGVQIQGNFGQKIENGKLVDEYYDGFTLTGFLPDIIKNIEGVSKEFEIDGAGSCGKGHKEWVRVSEGGPYLLIKELMLG